MPRITLQLRQEPHDFDAVGSAFKPLAQPDLASLVFDSVRAELLDSASADIQMQLREGEYELPLTTGDACRLQVPSGCQVELSVRAQGPLLSTVHGNFSEPVVFHNIVTTLSELRTIFKDHGVALARATDWLGPLGLTSRLTTSGQRLESLVTIHLTAFRGVEAVRRSGVRELRMRFDGFVMLAGQVRVPFRRVRLPRFILPTLHAHLADLIGKPLASADLLEERVPTDELLRAGVKMLERFEGRLRAQGTLPEAAVSMETFNGSALEAGVALGGRSSIDASFEGSIQDGQLTVECRGVKVSLDDSECALDVRAELDPLDPLGPGGRVHLTLLDGARVSNVRVHGSIEHPLAKGKSSMAARLDDVRVAGSCELRVDARRAMLVPHVASLRFSGKIVAEPGSHVDVGISRVTVDALSGELSGSAQWKRNGRLDVSLTSRAEIAGRGEQRVRPFPELSVPEGQMAVTVAGSLGVDAAIVVDAAEGRPGIEFEGTKVNLTLSRGEVTLDGLTLELPERSQVAAQITRGYLNATGLGEMAVGLRWDLRGASPILKAGHERAVLFVDDLRKMELSATVSPSGHISFVGGHEGLYDGEFLNALVDPLGHTQKWIDIISSDESMRLLLGALRLLSRDVYDFAVKGRETFLEAKAVFDAEGVTKPADLIPRDKMARVLSIVLAGDDRLQARLAAVIQRATDARGLDRAELKRIVEELFPDHRYALELDRSLRWIDNVLAPARALPPPAVVEVAPLVEDARHATLLEALPSAKAIYATVDEAAIPTPALAARIAQLAPWLSLDQLVWIVPRAVGRFGPREQARLSFALDLKRRLDLIAKGYGGIGYAPQAMAIAFFLRGVLAADEDFAGGRVAAPLGKVALPVSGILGPEDLAVLLSAGIATVTASRSAQLNQRLLFGYLLERPPLYFAAVLVEMGRNNARVLSNVLLNLLNQDQQHLHEPLDLPATFSKLLGFELPRREHFMAGGRRAKDSYYGALLSAAERVIAEAEPYLAVKHHLQVMRHPVPAPVKLAAKAGLDARAKKAIGAADRLGAQVSFMPELRGPVDKARQAYEEAFEACRAALVEDPRAFQRDWFKAFWFRNHEALVVRSVVRNYEADVDRVRPWLHVRTGRTAFEGEQSLLEGVIGALYYFEEDRKVLLGDPLVRLLVDPPPGKLDFTIVSGMGVVTEGSRGTELEASFRRLRAERGVETIRADTGTAKPLEFNAARVIEAIERVKTPYGVMGYSQGCGNVLKAEAVLRGGTPARRALLDGMRCRNFLFSAVNGSAHGSCGNEKFVRALVEGEAFLKYYQALFSANVIDTFNSAINAALGSPMLSIVLDSVASLSHEGVVALARDGQFLDHVPTSTVRGAIHEQILPEALELLSHVISSQVQGALHDTQVTLVSAVGHPNRVTNVHADALKRCDIGSFAQASHHWSPLLEATEFLTTERDRARCIYDFPKDRHVFPWVEVNARFGNIAIKRASRG